MEKTFGRELTPMGHDQSRRIPMGIHHPGTKVIRCRVAMNYLACESIRKSRLKT
ncbi:MAG: hypothetical protein MW690_001461 [Methanophagales archaeon]|nr:hypothetical protein [Methanophagales archaeon]